MPLSMSIIIQIYSYSTVHIHDGTAHSVKLVKPGIFCPSFPEYFS